MNQHIVVIESDPASLSEIAVALENRGYQVTGFESLTTIEELAALHAGLFIIDERLPTVSGHIICIMPAFRSAYQDDSANTHCLQPAAWQICRTRRSERQSQETILNGSIAPYGRRLFPFK